MKTWKQQLKKADKNWKHWNTDERARYAEKLVELFENSDFGMNVPRTNDRGDDVIAAIFGSHFKNQMETKTGEGLVDVAYRKRASETLFGTKLAKTKDAEFEKYGFLMDKDMYKQATSGIADQYWRYGDGVQVRFKKDMVKTTFTIGDSLGAGLTPSYTSDPKVVSSRNAHINRVLALTETKSAADATGRHYFKAGLKARDILYVLQQDKRAATLQSMLFDAVVADEAEYF